MSCASPCFSYFVIFSSCSVLDLALVLEIKVIFIFRADLFCFWKFFTLHFSFFLFVTTHYFVLYFQQIHFICLFIHILIAQKIDAKDEAFGFLLFSFSMVMNSLITTCLIDPLIVQERQLKFQHFYVQGLFLRRFVFLNRGAKLAIYFMHDIQLIY